MKEIRLRDVFTSTPNVEYNFVPALDVNGEDTVEVLKEYIKYPESSVCIIVGPSKIGKTTLWQKVFRENQVRPLKIDSTITSGNIFKTLTQIIKQEIGELKSEATQRTFEFAIDLKLFSLKWGTSSLEDTCNEIKSACDRAADSEYTPELVIPILKKLSKTHIVVVENIHYLDEGKRGELTQQIRSLLDESIPTVFVGVDHKKDVLERSNNDLIGRVVAVQLGLWGKDKLLEIIHNGLKILKVELVDEKILDSIVTEAIGNPRIVQNIMYKLLNKKGIKKANSNKETMSLTEEEVIDACKATAKDTEQVYQRMVNEIARGLRQSRAKYKPYQKILQCLVLTESPQLSISRREILELADDIPSTSIDAALGRFNQMFKDPRFITMEYDSSDKMLYVLDSFLLFYIRQTMELEEKKKIGQTLF